MSCETSDPTFLALHSTTRSRTGGDPILDAVVSQRAIYVLRACCTPEVGAWCGVILRRVIPSNVSVTWRSRVCVGRCQVESIHPENTCI